MNKNVRKLIVLNIALTGALITLPVHVKADETLIKVYRLYYKPSGEHFLTTDSNERQELVKRGWRDEGVAFQTPTTGVPIYRMMNPNTAEHLYTPYKQETVHLQSIGWKDEGIAFYGDENQRVAINRVYNPNKFANNHLYTTDSNEANTLVSWGWRGEGVQFYVATLGDTNDKLPVVQPPAKPVKIVNPPYINQADPRWARYRVGRWTLAQSACGVCSLASAFSALLNREINPPEIANLLYAAGYFNQGEPGTTNASVVYAAQSYGVQFQQLTSPDEIRAAVKDGKIVTMAVSAYSALSGYGVSHAVTLFGYRESDDATSVFEPLNASRNGVYNITDVYNMRSTDPSDFGWGAPFYIFALWV